MQDILLPFAEWVSNTSLAQYIQDDPNAFPMLEVVHIIALSLVIGPIILLDLKLVGFSKDRNFPTEQFMKAIVPVAFIAFIFALITGIGLFFSQPDRYVQTPIFLIKMGLLVMAGLNMASFHLWLEKMRSDLDDVLPARARFAGLMSILLWISILFAGRFIGFLLAY